MISRIFCLILGVTALSSADESTWKEIDSGASNDIAYTISSDAKRPGMLAVTLTNRLPHDVRVAFELIPGPGDRGESVTRTALIVRSASSTTGIVAEAKTVIASTFVRPGLRISAIEQGTISEETVTTTDANGEQSTMVRRLFTTSGQAPLPDSRPLGPILGAISLSSADESTRKEIDSGASKDIAYTISSDAKRPGMLAVTLTNRLPYDVRVAFELIPGPGDRGESVTRTALIVRSASSTTGIVAEAKTVIASTFVRPGLRISAIEQGTISEETVTTTDANGEQSTIVRRMFTPSGQAPLPDKR